MQTLPKIWEKGADLKTICLHAEQAGLRRPDQNGHRRDPNRSAWCITAGYTERAFAPANPQEVRDYVKKVKDQGILAGVSTHCPDTIKRIMDEVGERLLHVLVLCYLSRPREEMEKRLGKVPVGEPFFESDPLEMTAAIRQASKPCLAFKLLAAGRLCWNQQSVEEAFKFAFANIKPTDAVIVGMFPRFSDQVRENTAYAGVWRASATRRTGVSQPLGLSSRLCKRSASGGGRRRGQVASMSPTWIMSSNGSCSRMNYSQRGPLWR